MLGVCVGECGNFVFEPLGTLSLRLLLVPSGGEHARRLRERRAELAAVAGAAAAAAAAAAEVVVLGEEPDAEPAPAHVEDAELVDAARLDAAAPWAWVAATTALVERLLALADQAAGAGGEAPWTALSVAQAAGRGGGERESRERRKAHRLRLSSSLGFLESFILDRNFAAAVAVPRAAGAGAEPVLLELELEQ